jgi:hypothetical protein
MWGGDVDHRAQQRLVAHDPGVVGDVPGSDGAFQEARQIGAAADLFQVAAAHQDVGEGHQVDGVAALEEGKHGVVDQVVRLVFEPAAACSRGQDVGDMRHLLVVQQDGPEQRAFGLQRRWVAVCWAFGMARLRG